MERYLNLKSALCKGCGICAAICSKKVFELSEESEIIKIAHPEACVFCKACVRLCPDYALSVQCTQEI